VRLRASPCSAEAVKNEDKIDQRPRARIHKRIGDRVEKGEPLATIHYNSDAKLAEAKTRIADSYQIAGELRGKAAAGAARDWRLNR